MMPRKDWVTLDGFRTDLRKCRNNSAKWRMINYVMCECEVPIQTIQQMFNGCPLTKYVTGLEDVHQVTLEIQLSCDMESRDEK